MSDEQQTANSGGKRLETWTVAQLRDLASRIGKISRDIDKVADDMEAVEIKTLDLIPQRIETIVNVELTDRVQREIKDRFRDENRRLQAEKAKSAR